MQIWVDGEKRLEQSLKGNVEPIYGRTYLPRKFKIGVALPEDNCIDVYTQDIGCWLWWKQDSLWDTTSSWAAAWAIRPV